MTEREIPKRILDALNRYAEDGTGTGGFLHACLENDCLNAVCRADGDSIKVLPEIMRYIHNDLPGDSWGSREIVQAWMNARREPSYIVSDAAINAANTYHLDQEDCVGDSGFDPDW